MRYWDASALVALLVEEPSTSSARAALTEDAGIVTWWASRIECASAIARLERSAALSSFDAARALDILRRLADGWHEVLPSEALRETACRLLRIHPLRSADAMQLAAATVMAGGQPGRTGFLCFDRRLRDVAEHEGFLVGP